MGVRHVPEITFAIDRSEKIGARMDQVFDNIEKRRKKIARKTVTSESSQSKTATSESNDKAK
jgi:ribosome-binding factor A